MERSQQGGMEAGDMTIVFREEIDERILGRAKAGRQRELTGLIE